MLKSSRFFLKDLKRRVGARLTDTRYVFELRHPEKLDRRHFPDETVHFMESFAEVPAPLRDELRRVLGPDGLDGVERFFGEHGRLCVLTADGRFGSMGWVRAGNHIPRWPIPLTARDWVNGRGFTSPDFRGRGMRSRCITAVYDRLVAPENRFLSDCHVWNDAAIRQFTRTGFEIIARGRPRAHSPA
jgi:GNAT superfamily N-acetyltransferase